MFPRIPILQTCRRGEKISIPLKILKSLKLITADQAEKYWISFEAEDRRFKKGRKKK